MTEDADDPTKPSRYVKYVKEFPYDIAVLQVSSIISTLATASEKMDYSDVKNRGETVTLQTMVVMASVTATVDDMEPFAVDKFLQPKAPTSTPEPSKKKKAGHGGANDDSPASRCRGSPPSCSGLLGDGAPFLRYLAVAADDSSSQLHMGACGGGRWWPTA
jgi:hypothetical protein